MTQPREVHAAHRKKIEQAQSGTARAALLGISDGLVTNLSLTLGVVGAGTSAEVVRVAGLASLIAGACSMAVGEYISMRGQAELLASVLAVERQELHRDPDIAHSSIKEILTNDGVSDRTAHAATTEIMRDPDKAMNMYARGHLGINPDELGSPWSAAGSSFVMFAFGAFIPLVAWFFITGNAAVITSLALAVAAALIIGGYLGITTSGRVVHSALRQLLVLVVAAGITYLIGTLFHTHLG